MKFQRLKANSVMKKAKRERNSEMWQVA